MYPTVYWDVNVAGLSPPRFAPRKLRHNEPSNAHHHKRGPRPLAARRPSLNRSFQCLTIAERSNNATVRLLLLLPPRAFFFLLSTSSSFHFPSSALSTRQLPFYLAVRRKVAVKAKTVWEIEFKCCRWRPWRTAFGPTRAFTIF
jgi:hypothetical protein